MCYQGVKITAGYANTYSDTFNQTRLGWATTKSLKTIMFNLYTVGHFGLWLFVGRAASISWGTFLAVSIGWEFLELVLPFEFAIETLQNKAGDVMVNVLGFGLGSSVTPRTESKSDLE